MQIRNDTVFCTGTYYLNASPVYGHAITVYGNVTINGNGTRIISGNSYYTTSVDNWFGIWTNNTDINNEFYIYDITLENFNVPLFLKYLNKGFVRNVTIKNATDHNILTQRIQNYEVKDSYLQFSNRTNFYWYGEGGSSNVTNVTVRNILFNGSNNNNCLHVNMEGKPQTNFNNKAVNNTFLNCITNDISGTNGFEYINNTFYNFSNLAIDFKNDVSFGDPQNASAKDIKVYGNIFYIGNANNGLFSFGNYTRNNSLFNNTYVNLSTAYPEIRTRVLNSIGGVSFSIQEDTTQPWQIKYYESSPFANQLGSVYFNYSGMKNFTWNNKTLTINKFPVGTYGYIYSNGTLIYSNVSSQTNITLSTGENISIITLPTSILNVNITHSNCNDNYNRIQSMNPNTPFCGNNATVFYQAIEGDTILFAQGTYRNDATPGFSISNKNYGASGVEAIAQNNNTILIPNYADFETTNTYWIHESTLANGDKIYNTTRISTSSNTLLCTVMNISLPMFNAETKANLSEPIFPTFSSHWDNTNDVLSIRVPTWFAVSSGGLTCGKGGSAITLTDVDNLKLRNFTILPSQYAISSTSGVDNFTISGLKIYGGSNDNGLIRLESATRINISDNFIYRADIERFNVSWGIVKGPAVHSETAGIKIQNCNYCVIKKNQIINAFNGIVAIGTTIGSSINLIVEQNNISGIMDDALEPEDYQHNQTWKNNTISNAYVGFSTTPANSCSSPSTLMKNVFDVNRSVLTSLPNTYTSATNVKAYNSQGWACWNDTQNTYLWQEGISCNGEEDNQINNSHTKNLYFTDDNRVFDCTGLNSSGNYYSGNNIYRRDGGPLARYINSISNATDVTTLTQMQAIMPEWFATSLSVDPVLIGYTPTNNFICANDIGAISCNYDIPSNTTYEPINIYVGQIIRLNNNGLINLK